MYNSAHDLPYRMRPVQKSIERLYLCGFMGSGKTTVGIALAKRLGWRFVDTDDEVQKSVGLSVAELFSEAGESAFRRWEASVVERLIGEPGHAVIALGGGALMNKQNLDAVCKSGWIVHLRVSAVTVRQRLAPSPDRPLYEANRIEELLEARRPGYEAAHSTVETDGRTVEEIVGEIIQFMSKHNP